MSLPKGFLKQTIIISGAVSIILFIIFRLSDYKTETSILLSLGVFIITPIWLILKEVQGKKRHSTILDSNGFKELLGIGFHTVNVNDYYGITGTYKGYIFDIYYDWSTYVRSKSYKALIFNVYFTPPLKSNGDVDENLLEDIAKRNHNSRWSMKNWNYWWRNGVLIMRNEVGIINIRFEKILKKMDLAVTTLKNEKLKPVDRATLESWRKQDPNSFVPEILTYFEKN